MQIATRGVFVVTGGAGALAGAVAETFIRAGARIVLADRSERVDHRAKELGALAVRCDLTSSADASRMVAAAIDAFGRVDGLVHTAGAFLAGPAHEASDEDYARMMDVNVRTLFTATRAVLPVLLDAGDGFVAGISSSAVWTLGTARMALYAAAKAAVAFYLRSLEKEVRGRGVRVAVVYPLAPIDTPANREDMPGADPRGWVEPEAIAEALLFAASRPGRGRLLELPIIA